MQRLTCDDCGHWLPLGPATDGGEFAEAVAIEVRAADLAALVECDGNIVSFDGAEIAGWIERTFDSQKLPEQFGEHAGYLARCIVEHEKDDHG